MRGYTFGYAGCANIWIETQQFLEGFLDGLLQGIEIPLYAVEIF